MDFSYRRCTSQSSAEFFLLVFFFFFCNGLEKIEMRSNRPSRSLFLIQVFLSLNLWAREEHGGFLRGLLALQFLSQPHTFRNLQFKKEKKQQKRTNKQNKRQKEKLDRFKGKDSNPTIQIWRGGKEKSLHIWTYFRLILWCQHESFFI